MAVFNEILAGRFNRSLQKLFSMKGPPPVPQLASEIIPVHPFASGAENRYLEGWDRFMAAATIAAGGAGNFTVAQLRNDPASNVLAVMEKILVVAGASDLFLIRQGLGLGNLPTLIPTVALDTRSNRGPSLTPSSRNTTVSQGAGSTVAVLGANGVNVQAELITTDIHEFVILPNVTYGVTANTANEAMQITFMWRERAMEPSEAF